LTGLNPLPEDNSITNLRSQLEQNCQSARQNLFLTVGATKQKHKSCLLGEHQIVIIQAIESQVGIYTFMAINDAVQSEILKKAPPIYKSDVLGLGGQCAAKQNAHLCMEEGETLVHIFDLVHSHTPIVRLAQAFARNDFEKFEQPLAVG